MGTVAIAGGGLKLNQPNPATYGTVKVNGDLNFAGTYYAYIAGAQGGAGNCDLVNVSGATDLTGSRLNVTVNGQLTQGKQWRIIDDTTAGKNIKGDFAAPITVNAPDNPNNLKLNNGLDPDDNTNYILSD